LGRGGSPSAAAVSRKPMADGTIRPKCGGFSKGKGQINARIFMTENPHRVRPNDNEKTYSRRSPPKRRHEPRQRSANCNTR